MRIYNLLVHGELYERIPVHESVLPVVERVLPNTWWPTWLKFRQWGFGILLLLIFVGVIGGLLAVALTYTLENVVIVGASAAGLSAADGLREGGYDGRITILGDEQHEPYCREEYL